MAMEQAATRTPEREAFYDRIGGYNMAPLWERLHGVVGSGVTSECKVSHSGARWDGAIRS